MKYPAVILIVIFVFQNLRSQTPLDWQISGITTITGTILDFEKYYKEYNTIQIQIDDWTNAYRRSLFTKIDSNGKFTISFFVFETQEVLLTFKNDWRYVFVSPEDTLEIVIDGDSYKRNCSISPGPEDTLSFVYNDTAFSDGLKYLGKTAKICQNYDHFQNYFIPDNKSVKTSINEAKKESLSYQDYKAWRDSIHKIELEFLDFTLKKNKYEPFFVNWLEIRYNLAYFYDLLDYYASYREHSDDSNSIDNVLTLIGSSELINPEILILNPGYYKLVINALHIFIKKIGWNEFREFYRMAILPSQIEEQSVKITPINELSRKDQFKAQYPFILRAADTINNNRIRESAIAHIYTWDLEHESVDLGLDMTLDHVSDENIKASIINSYNNFNWRQINTNPLMVHPESDTLLSYLEEKYKGHVLYIDIWGTWCGSCYSYFKGASELKKMLEGKKIVFIYLCCKCDKNKWEQDIKNYGLEGEHILLSSEQYAYLSNTFNIITIPRFIIIDHKGRIVDDNASRPVSHPIELDIIVKELTKYLSN